jgi:ADP-heptose:LPS heptosyltransferase
LRTSGDALVLRQLRDARAPAVFFSNGIGDRLLSLPTLRALRSLYGTRLRLVCDDPSARFFRTQLKLRDVIVVAHSAGDRRVFDAEVAAAAIGDCDVFLSLAPWSSETLAHLVERVAARVSVGFASFFDVPLARDYGKHSADLAFGVARVLEPSLKAEMFAGPVYFERGVRRRAKRLLAPLAGSVRVLTVHADTTASKMWRPERMTEAIERFLAGHHDFFCLVVGVRGDAVPAGAHGERVLNCCGLPLDLSMRLVATSDLFLGVDSCMLHVADLARVPGAGLFGPTSSHEFGFRFGPHRHLQATSMDSIAASEAAAALGELAARRIELDIGAGRDARA